MSGTGIQGVTPEQNAACVAGLITNAYISETARALSQRISLTGISGLS